MEKVNANHSNLFYLGTVTWDRFEMRIFKRVIRLQCPKERVKELTSVKIESGVDIELVMQEL